MRHRLLLLIAAATLCGCFASVAGPVSPPESVAVDSTIAVVKPDPNAIYAISYEDLDLRMQPDTLFEDWMLTQRVRDLDGKRVRLTGFMLPGFDSHRIKHFMMLREKECPYGVGGQAHH